ncbi:MAG TPA: sulfite exporter TauE/SafE family protein [Flavobacteriales bacterium]|nr:sulfite exporter TauE/SafE family protein [Flavobacteriales bacterium]
MDAQFLALGLFFLIAVLYSSVGHAGASGYLAVMALLSFAPDTIKPTSLLLNVVVAGIASWRYLRAGCFSWKVFWPVAAVALPLAFIGGRVELPARVFAIAAGVFLIVSALLMAWRAWRKPEELDTRPMPFAASLAAGAPIGFISGIIGVGGGIFLSPVLIQGRWAALREVSGISALFILVNSLAGLAGRMSTGLELHPFLPWWLLAVVLGGLLGSWLGVSRFGARAILIALFLVLMTAGVKLLVTA